MMTLFFKCSRYIGLLSALILLISGCGGGGSDSPDPDPDLPQWLHPKTINDRINPVNINQLASMGDVAISDNGDMVIVWKHSNYPTDPTVTSRVYMSEFRNGSWNHPASINDAISPNNYSVESLPRVAIDSTGNTVVVWSQKVRANSFACNNSNCTQIFISEYRNKNWNHPSDINDYIDPYGNGSYDPEVVMSDNGDTVIAWHGTNTTIDMMIFMSEYRNGNWTHPATRADFISPAGDHAYNPKLAMDDSGNTIIIWKQSDNTLNCASNTSSCEQLYMSEYRTNSWSHPSDLTTPVSFSSQYRLQFQPFGMDVAMDNNAEAIVTWQVVAGSSRAVYKSEYRSGTWTYPLSPSDAISDSSISAWDPQVVMSDNGDAVISWIQDDNTADCSGSSCKQLFISEYRNNSWSLPADLNDNISPDGSSVYAGYYLGLGPLWTDRLYSLAMSDNGDSVISWSQPGISVGCTDATSLVCMELFIAEYRGNTWTKPTSLSDFISLGGETTWYPRATMNNFGDTIIGYQQDANLFVSVYK